MTDHIKTVTMTDDQMAAFESGRKIGWNEGIEAAAKLADNSWGGETDGEEIRALSMPAPAQSQVTRLVIVDQNGRRSDESNVRVELSYQDEGRTIKVFLSAALIAASEDDGA